MILILLTLQVTSTPYQKDYTGEGYATLNPDSSPAKITIQKGLALMMVKWPDAILKISIPGVLSSPIQLAAKNNYSLFTFADNAIVDIVFNSEVTYFVIQCPQYSSIEGATQHFSNYQSNTISLNSISKDQYFSVYGKYKMEGSISQSLFGGATLYYYVNNSMKLSTKNLSPLDLPSLVFTSALIRSKISDKVSFENLKVNCDTIFSPTVPTTVSLNWSSVTKDQNNFLANMAYGGCEARNTLISSLLIDLSIYTLELQLDADLLANTKIEIDIGSGKSEVSKNQNYSKTSPFTAKLYVTYKDCQSSQFAAINVNEIGNTIAHFTLADIQELCEKLKYTVTFQTSFQSSVTIGYQKNNDDIISFSVSDGYSSFSIEDDAPFIFSFYIKYNFCKTLTKIKEYSIEKPEVTYINFSDDDIPDECSKAKTKYYVKIKNDLTSEISLYVQNRNDEQIIIQSGEIYSDSFEDYNPFKVDVFIQTFYCSIQKIKTIIASEIASEISIDDSLIPDQCIPYKVCLSSQVDAGYKIGYINLDSSSTEIKEINDRVTINNNAAFNVQTYLMSSPKCNENYTLKKYTAEKKFECVSITMNDIPSECKETTNKYEICANLQNLPTKYTIGYKRSYDKEDKMITAKHDINKETYDEPFSITAYLISSPGCSDNIFLGKYDASESFSCIQVTEDDIPSECKGTTNKYEICANLQNLPTKYTIGYKRSYDKEDKMITAKHDINKETYDEPFSITAYLISSPGCSDNIFLGKYDATEHFICLLITEDDIPIECTANNENSKTKNKSINLPLIAGISVGGIAIIVIVVGIFIMKKRKYDTKFDSTSQTLGSNLLNDNKL